MQDGYIVVRVSVFFQLYFGKACCLRFRHLAYTGTLFSNILCVIEQ
jgi:hypothetical protein